MSIYKTIDVSTFQGIIDWDKVKASKCVDFVMIRAGYGQNNIDAKFVRNISECNRVGIPCGVYWFSYATTTAEAKKEAEYCLNAVKPYKLELPIAFDFEYDSVNKAKAKGVTITKTLATAICKAFCSTIEAAKYYVMVYSNGDYLNKYFDSSILKLYDLWYAAWPSKVNIEVDKPSRSCGIWQYGTYTVPGISGNVDGDVSYKNYPTIIKNAKLNNIYVKTKEEIEAEEKAKKEKEFSDAVNLINSKNHKDIILDLASQVSKVKSQCVNYTDYSVALLMLRNDGFDDIIIKISKLLK